MPKDLVITIDEISNQKGLSRSKFISMILKEKIITLSKEKLLQVYERMILVMNIH